MLQAGVDPAEAPAAVRPGVARPSGLGTGLASARCCRYDWVRGAGRCGDTTLAFVDVPGLSEALQGAGPFRVLSAQELDAPVRAEALSELAPRERKEIKYWKPRRVGEVLFNFWD